MCFQVQHVSNQQHVKHSQHSQQMQNPPPGGYQTADVRGRFVIQHNVPYNTRNSHNVPTMASQNGHNVPVAAQNGHSVPVAAQNGQHVPLATQNAKNVTYSVPNGQNVIVPPDMQQEVPHAAYPIGQVNHNALMTYNNNVPNATYTQPMVTNQSYYNGAYPGSQGNSFDSQEQYANQNQSQSRYPQQNRFDSEYRQGGSNAYYPDETGQYHSDSHQRGHSYGSRHRNHDDGSREYHRRTYDDSNGDYDHQDGYSYRSRSDHRAPTDDAYLDRSYDSRDIDSSFEGAPLPRDQYRREYLTREDEGTRYNDYDGGRRYDSARKSRRSKYDNDYDYDETIPKEYDRSYSDPDIHRIKSRSRGRQKSKSRERYNKLRDYYVPNHGDLDNRGQGRLQEPDYYDNQRSYTSNNTAYPGPVQYPSNLNASFVPNPNGNPNFAPNASFGPTVPTYANVTGNAANPGSVPGTTPYVAGANYANGNVNPGSTSYVAANPTAAGSTPIVTGASVHQVQPCPMCGGGGLHTHGEYTYQPGQVQNAGAVNGTVTYVQPQAAAATNNNE